MTLSTAWAVAARQVKTGWRGRKQTWLTRCSGLEGRKLEGREDVDGFVEDAPNRGTVGVTSVVRHRPGADELRPLSQGVEAQMGLRIPLNDGHGTKTLYSARMSDGDKTVKSMRDGPGMS